MALQIRRLDRTGAALLREIRVAALRDAPGEFGESLVEALQRSDQGWSDLAPSSLVAELDGQCVGMAFAFQDQADPEAARVGGMWVAPSHRRVGIGFALLKAALAWVGENGARRVRLWANPATPGYELYRRAHFLPTGQHKPFPGDAARRVVEMQLERDHSEVAKATVHLVCGFLGAGKTTFARTLATRVAGVRFSVDELYLRLFANGPTHELDPQSMVRLLDTLGDLWPQVAAAGTDVVLDFGFWSRSLRDDVRKLAHSVGVETRLYWLRCPDDVAVARCLRRNGSAGSFLITEEGFVELKARFEPPDSDESAELVD